MFPTKPFDDEEHRTEHAIRHANVLNAVAQEPDIAGSLAGVCLTIIRTRILAAVTGSVTMA